MRILITTMEEPMYVGEMIRRAIREFHSEIVGVAILPGSPVSVKKGLEKIKDAIIFAIILGPAGVLSTFLTLSYHRIRSLLARLGYENPYSIESLAVSHGIPFYTLRTLNGSRELRLIRRLDPDLVINQAQVILRRRFLKIPRIGTLNRHGSLLPKYRGMMAPFWAVLHEEEYSGVSIHFVDEQIDHGPIVVQKAVPLRRYDTFLGLLKRIFGVTPEALIEAINKIRRGNYEQDLILNDDLKATYFSKPTLSDALKYYSVILRRFFFGAKTQ